VKDGKDKFEIFSRKIFQRRHGLGIEKICLRTDGAGPSGGVGP
jgi:hypothetical protein